MTRMPPGRRRYENQCKDPPFATSFFLAQAPLALKGAKDGAPARMGRPEKPQVSRRERHGGTPELQRTARRCRADPSLLSLGTSGRRYKNQCKDPPSKVGHPKKRDG